MGDRITWGPVKNWEPGNLHTLMPDDREDWPEVRAALDAMDGRRVIVTVEPVDEKDGQRDDP